MRHFAVGGWPGDVLSRDVDGVGAEEVVILSEGSVRLRRADGPRLWLGERGSTFGYDGLNQALRRRAQHAGIDGFHLHRLRHTAAHRWLAAGGSESGLMAMAGWSRTDMLVRYTRATAADRAAAEALRLDLGNI